MQKMTLEDTQSLVNSYVKSFGQCGAAQKLTEIGYRSPEGASILQAHIYRILNGSGTCLLAPETENQQQEPPTTEKPIAPVPKMQKRIAEELFANEELLQQEITKTAAELREELEDERLSLEELERSLPPIVPCTGDHTRREHRHLDRDIRVNAIFDRRQPVEFKIDDEGYEKSYFGIPCMMHHSSTTTYRSYQPRRYNRNVLSTRDLSIHQK